MHALDNEMSEISDNMGKLGLTIWFRILKKFCPVYLYEEIEGDLLQKFQRDASAIGVRKAKRKLIWNTISFFRPGIIFKDTFSGAANIYSVPGQVNFQRINNLTGWIVFLIAFVTYTLTVEETASFWDCGEFIAASYKLQVPHPPGAPLFLLMGRIFSFFAFGDVTKVAYAINMMSVLASSFTILFLFWSIVMIGRKLMSVRDNASIENVFILIGSGLVGALAYAFSDSFWFSAVEAEVYAMSSFFTAFVVWAVLKWDLIEDKGKANRWLILIAYMVGLSIGVHLLNLLTLPALALIFYFKSYKSTVWGIITTLAVSCTIVLFINDIIIPGLPTVAGNFEIFFVNTVGWFFGSGAIIFALMIIGSLIYGIYFTQTRNYAIANTLILATTFILIGYGSYTTVVVRSNNDPSINENAPKDVMSFVRYLRREQYGSRPLLFGPYFTASPVGYEYGDATYVKGKSTYELTHRKIIETYAPGEETVLPRAWDPSHKDDYERIMGLREGQRPTYAQNIAYMFSHQMGTMYMRYFLWNFAGRQSDEDGADWMSPREWFKAVPDALAFNKARNNFFMIPLFLGLMGMAYQFFKDHKNFAVLALLFVMLGVAIVGYLNSPPTEPRERDYIYAGSYYAFAFWIGLAVIALADIGQRIIKNKKALAVIASLSCLMAPAIMLSEGWDDHDRSNRFFSVDSATNTLNSCAPNGILFTGGDNDTFPLWHCQETEGCRTDLRTLVLTYYNATWNIDQTMMKAYESEPFPYSLSKHQYREGGPNDYIRYVSAGIESMDARQYLDLLAKDYEPLRSDGYNMIPSKNLTLAIDKKSVIARGLIPKGMEDFVVDKMQIKLLKNVLYKGDIAFLDLLVSSNWERPIYVNNNTLSQLNFDVRPYIVQEGNVFRILPVANPRKDRPFLVDTDKTYDLMLNKFAYRGLDDSSVYYNDDYKIPVLIHRTNLNSLAQSLLDKGKIEEANNVLSFSLEKMPLEVIEYDPSTPDTVKLLLQAGQRKKGLDVALTVGEKANEMASFLVSDGGSVSQSLRLNLFMLSSLQKNLYENGEPELAKKFEEQYDELVAGLEIAFESGRMSN